MAKVIVTMKIMPEDPSIDLGKIEDKAKAIITDFGGTIMSAEKQPVGFGIVAIHVKFNIDESKGDMEPLEKMIASEQGIESVEVIAVSRAFG